MNGSVYYKKQTKIFGNKKKDLQYTETTILKLCGIILLCFLFCEGGLLNFLNPASKKKKSFFLVGCLKMPTEAENSTALALSMLNVRCRPYPMTLACRCSVDGGHLICWL